MMSSTCVITVNNRSCCWCTVGRQIHVHSSLRSDDSEWVTDRELVCDWSCRASAAVAATAVCLTVQSTAWLKPSGQ